MKEKKLNIEYIRVFAIFLTILIHVSNVYRREFSNISNLDYLISLIYNSISRICVPLFFMVSGMLLINECFDFKKYFKRILKFILILFIWSLIYYLINNYNNIDNTLIEFFISFVFNADMSSKHLWFMYAIIALYIALPFIQNMCKSMTHDQEKLFIILWTVISGFSFLYIPISEAILGHGIDISYPIPIINGTYYLGYFVLGYILDKKIKNIKFTKNKNLFCIGLYCFSTLLIILLTYFYSLNYGTPYEYTLWYRNIFIILASGSVFCLFIGNGEIFKNKIILKLSDLTFGVYLIHVIFLKMIKNNFVMINYHPLLFIPLFTIIIWIISLIACYIIKKIPIVRKII